MADPTKNHAAGNPGEDPDASDAPRYLTKGGSADARAVDPFERPEVRWEPEGETGRRHGDLHDGLDPDDIPGPD